MQLSETKSLRTEDDHHRGVRNIDSDLDNGRRDDLVDPPHGAATHDILELG